MIELKYSIDLEKSTGGKKLMVKREATQGEVAMAVLELERMKIELLNLEFNDIGFKTNGNVEDIEDEKY